MRKNPVVLGLNSRCYCEFRCKVFKTPSLCPVKAMRITYPRALLGLRSRFLNARAPWRSG